MIVSKIFKGLARQWVDLATSLELQPRLLPHLILPLDMSEEPSCSAHGNKIDPQAETVSQKEPRRVPVDLGRNHTEALNTDARSGH